MKERCSIVGYGPNIKAARKAAGLTQKQLAEILGLATGTVQQYERGVREPRFEQLKAIANALNIDLMLLFGGGEIMEKVRLPIFSERFAQLRGERTQGEFADYLGISRPTVSFYENGTRLPDAFVLQQISEKCQVSSDWLLGISDVKSTDSDILSACRVTGLSEEAVKMLAAHRGARECIGVIGRLISEPELFLAVLDILAYCDEMKMRENATGGIDSFSRFKAVSRIARIVDEIALG